MEEKMKNQITIEEIARGFYCGHKQLGTHVIKNEEAWNNLWNIVETGIPARQAPHVDFNKCVVLAAFLGTRSSGGYGITLQDAVEYANRIEIIVQAHGPQSGITTMALTQPYHIVKVPKSDKKIDFVFACF